MALKPDYSPDGVQHIDFYMNVTAEKGQFVCINTSTSPSGAGMDQSEGVAFIHTTAGDGSSAGVASGVTAPLGFLMTDVVSLDLTLNHLNQYKDATQIGSKVLIVGDGCWVVTDRILGGITPGIGNKAILSTGGLLTNVGTHGTSGAYEVGRFLSVKDENGFAKVLVSIK